jgi:hypothetical protein
MSNYNYFQKEQEPEKKEIHPIWRGIGCIMTIFTPIISWAAAMVVIDLGKAQKWPFISEMSGTVRFSLTIYQIPFIGNVASYLSSIPYLVALVMFFVIFLILFTGVFSVLNAFLYRTFGPPRYSKLDAPAPRRRAKKYTR